ncbi:MAG: hypothetical protein WC322_02915 [Candidatus Paceibacterota bacterium]|jgi:hypothetical protein
MYSPEERETTVTTTDADEWVYINTYQRRYMTKMRANEKFEVLVDTGDYLQARIKASEWNPAQGAKRSRTFTPEQKAAAAERMTAARAKKTQQ